MMEKKVNILIADDHHVFRFGLNTLLKELAFVGEIYEAGTGQEVVTLITSESIDIVLLDIEMPQLNGIEALKQLKDELGDKVPNILILSMFAYQQYLLELHQLGISGYLLKDSGMKEVVRALEIIADNQQYYSPKIAQVLFEALANDTHYKKKDKSSVVLSAQEQKILALICEQYTCNEIAEKMFLSSFTVKKHRQNIILKTESENTVGLVLYAIRNGIVKL